MNKVLVLVYVPLFEQEYDVVIPINLKIGIIKKYLISSIFEMIGISILDSKLKLYNKDCSICYNNNIYVKNSGIKNGAKLILM